jgi:UDPglucose--hexose-1-phosphate uridylyltransferase
MVLEFRKDPLKGTIVVVANERALRPINPTVSCPFCRGAEKTTPPTKLALPPGREWVVRCFDNAFAIVKPRGKFRPEKSEDYFYTSAAYGEHEVIVETADHHQLFSDIKDPNHLSLIFRAYRQRFLQLSKEHGVGYVHLFKNHGRLGGASIEHEHSQIVALPFVPPLVRAEIEREKAFMQKTGKCLVCDLMEREKRNVILQNECFAVLCPSFARFPFETWIVSREHKKSIAQFSDFEGGQLMQALRTAIEAIFRVARDYNVVYHNGIFGEDSHFHAEIYPRPNIWAGLELGTGIIVNTKTEKESIAALGCSPSGTCWVRPEERKGQKVEPAAKASRAKAAAGKKVAGKVPARKTAAKKAAVKAGVAIKPAAKKAAAKKAAKKR